MVAIKDLEMPKNCSNCDFFMGDNNYCSRGCFIPWRFDSDINKPKNCPLASEQEIVMPYLDRLIAKMKERDEDNGGEPLNAIDKGYHLAYEHLCEEVDNLLKENKDATNN